MADRLCTETNPQPTNVPHSESPQPSSVSQEPDRGFNLDRPVGDRYRLLHTRRGADPDGRDRYHLLATRSRTSSPVPRDTTQLSDLQANNSPLDIADFEHAGELLAWRCTVMMSDWMFGDAVRMTRITINERTERAWEGKRAHNALSC